MTIEDQFAIELSNLESDIRYNIENLSDDYLEGVIDDAERLLAAAIRERDRRKQ